MGLTNEEILSLLAKQDIKDHGVPRNIKLGPLRRHDDNGKCMSRRCGVYAPYTVEGIRYCPIHALLAMNRIVIEHTIQIDLNWCNCESGKHSHGNSHSYDCKLYPVIEEGYANGDFGLGKTQVSS